MNSLTQGQSQGSPPSQRKAGQSDALVNTTPSAQADLMSANVGPLVNDAPEGVSVDTSDAFSVKNFSGSSWNRVGKLHQQLMN